MISCGSTPVPLIPSWRRFESCQRGRKREHYQWNMDIVGVEGVEAEVPLDRGVCPLSLKGSITATAEKAAANGCSQMPVSHYNDAASGSGAVW